jgi:hypothetical protein
MTDPKKNRTEATYVGTMTVVKATPKITDTVTVPSLGIIGEVVDIYKDVKGLVVNIKTSTADGITYNEVKTITNDIFVVVDKIDRTKVWAVIKAWFRNLFKK